MDRLLHRVLLSTDLLPQVLEGERTPLPESVRTLISPDDADLDLVIEALKALAVAGLDPADPETLPIAIKAARQRSARIDALLTAARSQRGTTAARIRHYEERRAQQLADFERRSAVYYMRLGNRVKIGCTTDLRQRIAQIQPEELLGKEPGGRQVEAERHLQFAALRVSGEWFKDDKTLRAHIATLPDDPQARALV